MYVVLSALLSFCKQPPAVRSLVVHEDVPFSAVSVYIRFGHKYQIDTLVQEGVTYLRALFPDNFKEYERRTSFVGSQAICAINLARLVGIDSILLAAFFDCVDLGARIDDGYQHRDGSIERLSRADLRICLAGAVPLTVDQLRAYMRALTSLTTAACLRPDL